MFVIRSDVDLAPGESRTLRFAYGYAPMGAPFAVDPAWRDPKADLLGGARADLAQHLVYFATNAPTGADVSGGALQREMAWHASQLEVSTAYRDYWGHHVVPQGSAYLYLHGADGALARSRALRRSARRTRTRRSRAKSSLLMTGTQFADDGRFSYAFQGNGVLDDALGLHAHPSDFDVFFSWALSEYVGATGDAALLDAVAPFYEAQPDATVWDHLVASCGTSSTSSAPDRTGSSRLGDGDWNDGIVFSAPDRALAASSGESVPNTQMAVAVLPRVADLVEPRDAALAAEIRAHVDAWRAALPQTWTGSFFGRAYFGDGNLFEASSINLESQVWALIGDELASDSDRAALVSAIGSELDDPSPAGATLAPGGQVWPAISGPPHVGLRALGRGRARSATSRATRWPSHALAFPDVWYGIWSGPDGLESSAGDRPGQAWYSAVTPMTDFPVQNANQHAMPLLALLRLSGHRCVVDRPRRRSAHAGRFLRAHVARRSRAARPAPHGKLSTDGRASHDRGARAAGPHDRRRHARRRDRARRAAVHVGRPRRRRHRAPCSP